MKRRSPACLLALCAWCLTFGIGPGARAVDTNAVLNGWLSAQTNLHTWNADMVQTRALKALTTPLMATGHVWFATPNRFRWELRQPSQTIALRQPDQMWVIYPQLKRAERYPLAGAGGDEWREALALLEAGFPRDRADLFARFRLLSLGETATGWRLGLQPLSSSARRMLKEIRLELGKDNFGLLATELVLADDSRMRNDFSNAVLNAPLDETLFRWVPDPAYKITEPLSK